MLEVVSRYPVLASCEKEIAAAETILEAAFRAGNKLLLCGNGGSNADAAHIAGELGKGFVKARPLSDEKKAAMRAKCPALDEEALTLLQDALPALPLDAGNALGSAFCNDVEPSLVYAQQVLGLGKPGDVLLALSTSGNSANVVEAAKVAKGLGLLVIALTGETGGRLRELSDVCIRVPAQETYKVQELHLPVYHQICLDIEEKFFG